MVYRYSRELNAFRHMSRLVYRKVPRRNVYRHSNGITGLPVPAAAELHSAALAIDTALKSGGAAWVTMASGLLVQRVCARLGVPPVRVRVLAERPANRRGELHGLYETGDGGAPRITVWMRTARRRQVVAFRTFLRTLLHELCHHLDYVLLRLGCSFHTAGFYRRVSHLYRQLLPSSFAPSLGQTVQHRYTPSPGRYA